MSLAFNKFDPWVEKVSEKEIDWDNDAFYFALSNTQPTAVMGEFADITEISTGNGYTTGGEAATISDSSQTSGVFTATISGDIMWTASGGAIGPFRYIVCYDGTATGDPLYGWWDYGSTITLLITDDFTLNTDGVVLNQLS